MDESRTDVVELAIAKAVFTQKAMLGFDEFTVSHVISPVVVMSFVDDIGDGILIGLAVTLFAIVESTYKVFALM